MKSMVQNKMNIMTLGVALLLAGATTSSMFPSSALAANDTAKDIQRLAEAKISLVDAIGIAEKHIGGKAIDADLDSDFGKVVYDVSVIKDTTEHEVRIDAITGDVLGTQIDKD